MHISLPQKRNGMYLFSHKDFDSAAEQLLQEHAPYMFEKAQSLAIENLADEAYSLMIMDRYLSASGSILGMINFSDIDIIEVPYEVYKQWNCEHMRSERNRKSSQDIQFFSLEDLVRSTGIELQTAANDLSSHQEDYILDKVLISQLYDAVSKWKPWGADMLTLYLEQKQKKTAQIISRKYHVSMQSVRKYKRQFEKFIKNFLTGVSFSG